jgi:hypothetical protein
MPDMKLSEKYILFYFISNILGTIKTPRYKCHVF